MPHSSRFYKFYGKRAMDVVVSLAALVLLSPLMGIISLLVRFLVGSPVLYSQERPGKNGKAFVIFKFRTMTESRGADGNLLPDADRLPTFGRFLRRTSLDELPELFNVLRGDMSLVGPRPLLMRYLPHYNSEQARRHDVKPGITGWAQVNGRDSLMWERKFELDVHYVDNLSLKLDLKILAMTVWRVLTREGTEFPDGVSMHFFEGSDKKDTDD